MKKMEKMDINNMDSLIEGHKEFAMHILKNNRTFVPQIVMSVKGKITAMTVPGDRDLVKHAISKVEKFKKLLDWVMVMHEGYSLAVKNPEDIEKKKGKYTSLEEGYLSGDPDIVWIFVIEVYMKGKKGERFKRKMVTYSITKNTFEFTKFHETDLFTGYLTLDL